LPERASADNQNRQATTVATAVACFSFGVDRCILFGSGEGFHNQIPAPEPCDGRWFHAPNPDVIRCLDADADSASADFDDGNLDVGSDNDSFAWFAAENEHLHFLPEVPVC
jgi:hypothetical protein